VEIDIWTFETSELSRLKRDGLYIERDFINTCKILALAFSVGLVK